MKLEYTIINGNPTYQVYFGNPLNEADVKVQPFDMRGDYLIARIGQRIGFANYQTKISEIAYVQNDPALKCKHYSKNNKYSDCLEQKLFKHMHSFLPCIPPWLTDDKENGVCILVL
jgi:hypothetical protein